MNTALLSLVSQLALLNGIDPNIALSVMKVESNNNPNAVGTSGEIGLFQVLRSNVPNISRKKLFKPEVNIAIGIALLAEAKKRCVHQKDNTWIVCFNLGPNKAKRVKHPKLFPYYKLVVAEMEKQYE